MNYDEAKRPSNIVTEQIVIDTKYNTRLIPVTAEKDSIDEINKALETAKKEHELLGLYREYYGHIPYSENQRVKYCEQMIDKMEDELDREFK